MADWNDIRKAFENDAKKEDDSPMAREQKILKSITFYISSIKGISPIQCYQPDEIVTFLDKPVAEIRTCLGSEWDSVSDDKMANLIYSLSKKVKKSNQTLFG